ncbi:MAG: hypothetical protein LBO75_05345 [Bifidobacteriaceae bacterium]|jgi:hypothetical protein|nr:hypothetical protein [Bifidobacteriaceae bacterium]
MTVHYIEREDLETGQITQQAHLTHPLDTSTHQTENTCRALRTTICLMGTLTIRTDAESEAALAYIRDHTGADKSKATRDALVAQAHRIEAEQLRAESAALRDDPADHAEMVAITAEMHAINAW